MMVIYKYELSYGANVLALPSDSSPLSIGDQGGSVVMWVLHLRDPEQVRVYARLFHVINTGESFDIGYSNYIGTIQKKNGIVQHVFEQLDVS